MSDKLNRSPAEYIYFLIRRSGLNNNSKRSRALCCRMPNKRGNRQQDENQIYDLLAQHTKIYLGNVCVIYWQLKLFLILSFHSAS